MSTLEGANSSFYHALLVNRSNKSWTVLLFQTLARLYHPSHRVTKPAEREQALQTKDENMK